MIKKLFITCSVMLVTVVISGLFINAKADTRKVSKNTSNYRFIYPKKGVSNDFTFADEAMPINDMRITRKMKHTLVKNSYNNLQSYILQEEAVKLFPIIVPILKSYGIPEDFKYMPLVEAGLKSGVSKRGAAGWWQFMPGSARTYGLKVGNGRDDRYSIRRSTIAACKYLKELHAQFNSWTIAAAAYNIGEIKMAKAIRVQGEDNYFRMHFNPETGIYVYRIIAMKEVIERPELYGYKKLNKFSLQPADLMAFN
ncbi:lytic transglycosylase domain-containing protein [Mucilaginibacter sp. McL0603]|uniref:lytic transglycosylase domain-containing protein n=1 Tax=Mucilaginibacter sp. McL0603 TaxID=3415670 RepID=UPI003CF4B3CC